MLADASASLTSKAGHALPHASPSPSPIASQLASSKASQLASPISSRTPEDALAQASVSDAPFSLTQIRSRVKGHNHESEDGDLKTVTTILMIFAAVLVAIFFSLCIVGCIFFYKIEKIDEPAKDVVQTDNNTLKENGR